MQICSGYTPAARRYRRERRSGLASSVSARGQEVTALVRVMQWTTPLWAETAGTSYSEDEEVPTSSAPLTKTYGGDGMRLYDQVILRAATEAQTSARHTNRPTKKETECAMHTKPEGVGLESPLGYKTQREAR
jgi:hypothetical protein